MGHVFGPKEPTLASSFKTALYRPPCFLAHSFFFLLLSPSPFFHSRFTPGTFTDMVASQRITSRHRLPNVRRPGDSTLSERQQRTQEKFKKYQNETIQDEEDLHLLLHTSGLSYPDYVSLVGEYLADDSIPKPTVAEDAPPIVKNFSVPLVFEPGEGFCYGCSIHWTQLLVGRMAGGGGFIQYIQENTFDPLGMTSATYMPRDNPDIWNRRLRMAEREGEKLLPADDAAQGLVCSVSDVGRILGDLISPSPKLLDKQKSIELLFTGQLQPSSPSFMTLRSDQDSL